MKRFIYQWIQKLETLSYETEGDMMKGILQIDLSRRSGCIINI